MYRNVLVQKWKVKKHKATWQVFLWNLFQTLLYMEEKTRITCSEDNFNIYLTIGPNFGILIIIQMFYPDM